MQNVYVLHQKCVSSINELQSFKISLHISLIIFLLMVYSENLCINAFLLTSFCSYFRSWEIHHWNITEYESMSFSLRKCAGCEKSQWHDMCKTVSHPVFAWNFFINPFTLWAFPLNDTDFSKYISCLNISIMSTVT